MAKKLATALEIQAEINRRLAASTALDGDCKQCRASLPRQASPAHYDRNWHSDMATNCDKGCLSTFADTLRAVGSEYDCSDW